MLSLLFAGQIIGICIIFFTVSRNKFTVIEKVLIFLFSIIIGLGFGYYIESWSGLLIGLIFMIVTYYKNNKNLILWDLFAALYSLVSYVLFSFVLTIPVTSLYQAIFNKQNELINMLSLITIGMLPAFINYIIVQILKKYFIKKNYKSVLDLSQTTLLISVLFLTIILIVVYSIVYVYNVSGILDTTQNLILGVMALLILISFAYILIRYTISYKNQLNQLKEMQFNDLMEYSKQIETLYNDISGFEHDYLNIILSLETSINNNDMDGVKDIFNEVIAPTKSLVRQDNHCLVKIRAIELNDIKSIISAKIIMALSYKLNISVEIEQPLTKVYMNRLTLIRILSIILDNAIEASTQTDDKIIIIAIMESDEEIIFEIRNSFSETIDLKLLNSRGFSTKGPKRGYGLSNINELLLNDLFVSMETSRFDKVFAQKIIIRKHGSDNEYHNS